MPNVHWTWSFSLFIASWGAQERDGSSWCCELQSKLGWSGKGWIILTLWTAEQWSISFAVCTKRQCFAWLQYSSWHLYTCTVHLFRKAVYGSLFSSPDQEKKAWGDPWDLKAVWPTLAILAPKFEAVRNSLKLCLNPASHDSWLDLVLFQL